uniref:HORMA domain-containing protein n=1 Tax=Aquila chrysaetos chrysaetos TaxID=223781 RepID=A0A663DU19_AQUCH
MATHQLLQTRQKKKSSTESVLFPDKIATEQQSVALVKRLLAISVSCITYMRGLFPESSYGTRCLDGNTFNLITRMSDALIHEHLYVHSRCVGRV